MESDCCNFKHRTVKTEMQRHVTGTVKKESHGYSADWKPKWSGLLASKRQIWK